MVEYLPRWRLLALAHIADFSREIGADAEQMLKGLYGQFQRDIYVIINRMPCIKAFVILINKNNIKVVSISGHMQTATLRKFFCVLLLSFFFLYCSLIHLFDCHID